MSGFDPVFDPAGTGARDGAVPHPGAIDGVAYFLRADGTWAIPPTVPPVPPPPSPGPTLDQWACNLAGWMVYDGVYAITKVAINGVGLPILGDAISIVVGGLLATFWPELIAMDAALATAIGDYITTWITGHVATFATAILDPVIWSKIHCYVFGLIEANPTALNVALGAASASAMVALGIPSQVAGGVALLLQKFGFHSFLDVPLSAFVREYDCSNCAVTHQSDGGIVTGIVDDLSVSDGTTTVPVVHALHFVDATVSGTPPTATVTPNNATASTVGVSRPDNATLGVSAGVLSVLNGQLATINLDQIGTFTVNSGTGTTISGLVVGNTYALQSTGGPFHPHGSGSGDDSYSWEASVDGSTWQDIFALYNGAGAGVTTPAWALSAALTDSTHARVVWVATATTARMRVSDSTYGDNTGSLGWQLLDVVYEGSEILVEHGGTKVGTRPVLDIVDSSTVTATITDDPTNDRVTVSLAATATGGGTVGSVTSVSGTAPVAVATGTTTPVISVGVFDGHGGSHPTGLVPDPGGAGATSTFLRADGTYAVPPGTGGAGTVTAVTGTAPISVATGTTTPVISLTTPLNAQYGGLGADLSAVIDGQIVVGQTSGHKFQLGSIVGGTGVTVAQSGGVFTVSASGSGGGGTAMSLLATITVTPIAVGSISITGFGGYSHLRLVIVARGTDVGNEVALALRFNADVGTNYDWEYGQANGAASWGGSDGLATNQMQIGEIAAAAAPADVATQCDIFLANYAGTTFHKTALSSGGFRHDNTANRRYMTLAAGWWRNTAAITSILLFPASGSIAVGSQVWIYGIA